MKFFLFLLFGIFLGLYLSWPGLLIPENWKCFNQIIAKSAENKISLKAALEISPNYFQIQLNDCFLFLFSGIFGYIYLSWPCLLILENWKYFYLNYCKIGKR